MNKEVDINELLKELSLSEKIGQLQQLASQFYIKDSEGELTGPLKDLGISEEKIWVSGSVLGVKDAEEARRIQDKYLDKSSTKIPLLFMADIIHGYRTIFPIPLAIGCTWNLDNAVLCGQVSAKEAALSGVHVTFSPMVDLVRDPRWGRVMESTGEDTYLNSVFGKAFVEGYQGDLSSNYNIASCVKHFAAYGAVEAGREYNTVDLSDRQLKEYYLPSYKASIDEGAKMVMTSFNTIHGVPASGSKYLMQDILRDNFQFDGVVISDWGAVGELQVHGVAADDEEVAEKAISAGVDVEMMTSCYINNLENLVKEGRVQEELIDEAVLRILQLKKDLGLFSDPYRGMDGDKAKQMFMCNEHKEAVRKVARESIVLLKNDNVLPLSKDKKIAVIGPKGDSTDLLGGWSWQGRKEKITTLKENLINEIGNNLISYAKGCDVNGHDESGFEEAVNVAKEADVVILALGESSEMSGEGGSRAYIGLPGVQERLAEEILRLNKPTVVLLFSGRPLEITNLSKKAPAIIEAWFPGTEGGSAITEVLYGDFNPSGRLTTSFPYATGQIPVYYNSYNTGRPKTANTAETRYVSQFIDIPNEPLYPFGYGLSYTQFQYKDFTLSSDKMTKDDKITASVTVKNIGDRKGTETVQFYIRDLVGSTVRPVKELKGFKRIELEPQEESKVEFVITEEMLRYYNIDCELVSEPGDFHAMVGCNSADTYTKKFTLL
ncbi:glycoside hydrolase family 3 N-terminal domain-containing protein [Vallitalea guaymasensis]|uniref:beta-glucosidase n=1 Tax=Vallitalea guaymasensis TaxID=1185412 RepID=A0A8J8MD10_9FIRM|nr:glycoside hydrolase family 3 N-terminal domain-containing protein [Vallitalea guaymasensis]QUH30794.1 glycoside hydrolase family 3 C-terminal domain-containing protein [Vallitalea guaymasensis]